ncbi:MAG: hypothetical protein JXB47_04245 [Anaerolineae bacterium]|nr:hypothetical protein [Anaerolineae bacterium]
MGFDFDKYDDSKDKARAKRLKEQRVKRHDPGPKVKANWDPQRRQKRKSAFRIVAIWQSLGSRTKGAIVGLIFGMVAFVPMVLFLEGWYKLLGIPALLIMIVVWMVIYKMLDSITDF